MQNFEIFRAVEKKANNKDIHEHRNTMRPPGNVPYVVDNLWEWKRPDEYPNRRYSAFASPTATLAQESAKEGSTPYRVEFKGRYKLCQLIGWGDSKYHPECRKLKNTLLEKIGKNWVNYSMQEKTEVGKLFMPCLKKEEVNDLFETVEALKNIRQELYDAIRYWNHVVLIKEGDSLPDPTGEVFFEAFDGYELREIRKGN